MCVLSGAFRLSLRSGCPRLRQRPKTLTDTAKLRCCFFASQPVSEHIRQDVEIFLTPDTTDRPSLPAYSEAACPALVTAASDWHLIE